MNEVCLTVMFLSQVWTMTPTPKVSSRLPALAVCLLAVSAACWLSSQTSTRLLHLSVSESTIIAEQSTVLADQTLTGSEDPAQTLSRVCGEDREESTYCPSSCATAPGPSEHGDPETPTIYCRERSRRTRPGESEQRQHEVS